MTETKLTMPERVFGGFADSWQRNEYPDPRFWLCLVQEGPEREELREMITTWMMIMPPKPNGFTAPQLAELRNDPLVAARLAAKKAK